MQLKQLAADTRDPLATIAFGLLGIAGALGWIPDDLDANTLAQVVGALMGVLAGVFSFWHHKDFKVAIREGRAARELAAAPAAPITDDSTPLEGPADDGGE